MAPKQTDKPNKQSRSQTYLRLYVNYQQDDWATWLDIAEFCLNDRYHTAIKTTPFFQPRLPPKKGQRDLTSH